MQILRWSISKSTKAKWAKKILPYIFFSALQKSDWRDSKIWVWHAGCTVRMSRDSFPRIFCTSWCTNHCGVHTCVSVIASGIHFSSFFWPLSRNIWGRKKLQEHLLSGLIIKNIEWNSMNSFFIKTKRACSWLLLCSMQFGHVCHVGRNGSMFKTEAMYFPSPAAGLEYGLK